MTDRICVAQIGAPHGVRGEVRLRSFTEDPLAFVEYGPLESEDRKQRFKIEALRPAKDHFVARLSGVSDRNAAEKLTNVKLYVPRDVLPDIEEDETFYHADLMASMRSRRTARSSARLRRSIILAQATLSRSGVRAAIW